MTKTERLTWLESRRGGLGATDIASIVGAGFSDPITIWKEKVNPVEAVEKPVHNLLLMGLATEEINAANYAEKMGAELIKPGMVWAGPDAGFPLFANLDYACWNEGRPIDTKYTPFFDGDKWGEQLTADMPTGYHVQLNCQMHCFGPRETADISALAGTGEHRVYRTRYDAELMRMLLEVGAEFWINFVLPRKEPPADWKPGASAAIVAYVNAVKPDTCLHLSNEVVALAEEYKKLKGIEKEAQERAEQLYHSVMFAMGDHERATGNGGWKFKRSFVAGGPVSFIRKDSTRLTITAPKGMK